VKYSESQGIVVEFMLPAIYNRLLEKIRQPAHGGEVEGVLDDYPLQV
jgi:hypothetical protein